MSALLDTPRSRSTLSSIRIMSTPSIGSDSDGSIVSRKRPLPLLGDEEIEPYVRRKKAANDRTKKRMENLNEDEQNVLRTCINSRERRRMHDLNDAYDELRAALPQQHAASARRLSKITTIILATNIIRQQSEQIQTLRDEIEALRGLVPPEKLPPPPALSPVFAVPPPKKPPTPAAPTAATLPTPAAFPKPMPMVPMPTPLNMPAFNPMYSFLLFKQLQNPQCMRLFNPAANCHCPQCLSNALAPKALAS